MNAGFHSTLPEAAGHVFRAEDVMAGLTFDSGGPGLGAPSHDGTSAQPFGDPMDLDLDFDAALWVADLDGVNVSHEPAPDLTYCPPMSAMPADFLFAEDEAVLPPLASYHAHPSQVTGSSSSTCMSLAQPIEPSPTRTVFSVARSDTGSDEPKHPEDPGQDHDVARQRLRRQLSLLSKGWAGDEIRFKNCDPSKAVVLHALAMELRLAYNHDVSSREVSMSRPRTAEPAASKPQLAPGNPPSSMSRSSTELDSALCLPGLPSFPEVQIPSVTVSSAHEPETLPARPIPQDLAAADQPLARRPSRSERISDSISKHVSTLKTSISKGGRRGPLSEISRRDMRALEAAGGACWRCKVLRRKCDLGSPCRSCLQSVPMPHFGEEAPLWPLIGCRRGPLRDSMPAQLLCPKPKSRQPHGAGDNAGGAKRCRSADIAERCLLSAESQRLADMKAVFEGAAYKLSIASPSLRDAFSSFIEAGRYRDRACLHRSYLYGDRSVTYTELIAVIAWELAENHPLLPSLEIKSWQSLMAMLETACIYESEVGQTSLVILSMVCLKHCLEALRLHSASLLSPGAHEDCGGGQCQVECVHNLRDQVAAYVDELSSVIFNKENMRDRRWWLSTFYSLYIQSYVRHALIAIEKQLRFRSADDVPAEDLTSTQYLHLPAVLFTAASAKYDPLLGGRLQYALTDNSVIPETSVPEAHHSHARKACEVDKWPEAGIRSPYEFLRRQLQIGSLDFSSDPALDIATRATSGSGSPLTVASPCSSRSKFGSPLSPASGTGEEALGYPKYLWRNKRDSIDSRYSTQASTMFSNQSSDSLARTISTDMTSLYEASVFAALSFSESVSDLSRKPERGPDMGTISPAGVLFARPSPSSLSFEQAAGDQPAQAEQQMSAAGPERTLVCSCCPRAPRRFRTTDELTQHEAEKPHPCTECKRRFRSPTEAERHINAIHRKSAYWTCRALEDPMLAFHPETIHGTVWDICGFCGGGFARRGGGEIRGGDGNKFHVGSDVGAEAGGTGEWLSSLSLTAAVPSPDRDELVSHVEAVHKLGECDGTKRFYRVDNFRQHLKNSHVAKAGKWLKQLEQVCSRSTGEASER